MLNKALEISLNDAFRIARDRRHELMTVEHLLLALLDNPEASQALRACGLEFTHLKQELLSYVERSTPSFDDESTDTDTQPTLGFQRVLQRAVFHVQSSGNSEVTGANVLVAIFGEQESHAVYLLNKHDITRLDVVHYLSHGLSKIDDESTQQESTDTDTMESQAEDQQSFLKRFCTNLNARARDGRIDPLIGRDDELERCIQVLCRRRKNNPLLVGEAGVGKTAIAEGLAYRIVNDEVPEVIANAVIYSLDMGGLLAGTKYRGDFEKRFKQLLKELADQPDAILFIDEIHTIIGAGAASGGVLDASNLLKPLLSSGELKCIGSTTYTEFKNIFEKDRALVRRFQKIDVLEPSVDDTTRILQGLKERYESHHGIRYTQPAIRAAAELSARYINERHLPDKAIDVLDEAGASQRLLPPSRRKKTIGVQDIESIIAKMARIPEQSVSRTDQQLLKNLDRNLKLVVFGQDQAIEQLTSAIRLSRSGLGAEQKPIGSFLFAGPTGVGKTEITQQLAKALGIEFQRFDMSEYMERHAVSRLIGAPPGYVGFDQGGLLTDAIIKHPHCVLLLDEIEKAHSDIYNILLQVMDHGTLTDNNGRKADFRNVILVMTTNAGVQETVRQSIGFQQQDHAPDAMVEINRTFSPEFRNRLDSIVWFNHLNQDVIEQVVDKFVCELQAQLDKKHVSLELEPAAVRWLAEKGYDKTMGARPMARVIQEHLKKPLANEILFGKLAQGGAVRVSVAKGELNLAIEERETRGSTAD
ncbi:ATP-dependent Clp protease ATP-binding subunit ClpA [Pseudidiomarina donghaiensis]|uniref:ATP-dependent Clp protease ATP-binding subunit ClpA n=1 Tax=Pseudidiomarina donghaiensis TaxID=519452 RepID=A0A432XMK7_9GAMM|nr:ATP-dependent Clp protease ATP-binding subunit ClpA [Pseudidiomarina donghaiensis]RUO49927.1 ATP-dependent Clp protease ATP-binding subunit ClpA [Pseudidiomarina donghaiensis]SFV22155.1 ATP-dependent Clp protease ATP-binding subunit ClpA [Pseudidiomarina donghaiensis]